MAEQERFDLEQRPRRAGRTSSGRSRCATRCARSWPPRSACAGGADVARDLDDERLQHRPRRPRPRPRRRDRHDRRRALRPARRARGLAGAACAWRRVRELPPEESLEVLLREVTPKTRLLALSHVCWMSGNRFPVEELKEATGAAGAGRRRPVGRRDPGRRDRLRLLRLLVPEVALRARRDGRPRRPRPGGAARHRAELPLAGRPTSRPGTSRRAKARARFDSGWTPPAVAGRARGRARRRARGPLRARAGDDRALPRAARRARES